MTHYTHTSPENQGVDKFPMELSLAIRQLYTAANLAHGPAFKKLLTRAASDLEDAKRVYGVRAQISDTADRLVKNAGGRAA